MKALVLTTYPPRDASRRLRIDPLVRKLSGFADVEVHTLLTQRGFGYKNHPVFRFYTAITLAFRLLRRIYLILVRRPDILVVHREAFPFFTPHFERLATSHAKFSVLDIDDAVFVEPTFSKDWRRIFRRAAGARDFRSIFDLKLVGNAELSNAMRQNDDVLVLPTCPDPIYLNLARSEERLIVWIGSESTLGNLVSVLSDTLEVCAEMDYRLLVVGGRNVHSLPAHPRLEVAEWSSQAEETALRRGRLGIMPLSNSEWDRGKSGFKAILYLFVGMHALVTPVGINKQIAEEYSPAAIAASTVWAHSLRDALKAIDQNISIGAAIERVRRDFDSTANVETAVGLLMQRYNDAN